jgi:hypothetical protein
VPTGKTSLAVSLLTASALAIACSQAPEAQQAGDADPSAGVAERVPGTTAREAVDAAIEALGGAERIATVRNITMLGYGQYAYQNGGGNITALPDAPQKYIAANDLRRIYDLENGRYYAQERRNMLFPFAGYGGHSFALNRQILDGDEPFRLNEQGEVIAAMRAICASGCTRTRLLPCERRWTRRIHSATGTKRTA